MEEMGVHEVHLTAKEKHARLVIERKKVINDQLKLLLMSLAMNGNRELRQKHLKRIREWYDTKYVAAQDGVTSKA